MIYWKFQLAVSTGIPTMCYPEFLKNFETFIILKLDIFTIMHIIILVICILYYVSMCYHISKIAVAVQEAKLKLQAVLMGVGDSIFFKMKILLAKWNFFTFFAVTIILTMYLSQLENNLTYFHVYCISSFFVFPRIFSPLKLLILSLW